MKVVPGPVVVLGTLCSVLLRARCGPTLGGPGVVPLCSGSLDECQAQQERNMKKRNLTRDFTIRSVLGQILQYTNRSGLTFNRTTYPTVTDYDPGTLETIEGMSKASRQRLIVTFSEQGDAHNSSVIQFRLNTSSGDRTPLLVDNATMWVRVRVSRRKSRKSRAHSRRTPRVKMRVDYLPTDGEPMSIASINVRLKKTDWVTFNLPHHIVQRALDTGNHLLKFRLTCSCSQGITPVMALRKGRRTKRNNKKPKRDVSPRRARVQNRHSQHARRRKKLPSEATKPPSVKRLNKRRPFLYINTRPRARASQSRITKRSVDCPDQPESCCKKSLYVDFDKLGLSPWILMPKGYMASYCDSTCGQDIVKPDTVSGQVSFIEGYNYIPDDAGDKRQVDINSKCSPTKLMPLSLLYIDQSGNIIKNSIPNMIVEDCGCA